MAQNKYDVIVIGSGVGGMGAAALLAKDFNQKVLVLEKSPFIGGRTLSFVGRGNKATVTDWSSMHSSLSRFGK